MATNILDHKGLLTFSSIDSLLNEFMDISSDHNIKFSTYKRILTVMIESLENVYKYKDQYEHFVEEEQQYMPSFSILKNKKVIKLITSNPVRNTDIGLLKEKIDNVNSRNRKELNDLFVKTITNDEFSPKGGAGLGFIEMAKSSGNALYYSFEEITGDFSLYTFIVTFEID